MTIKIILATLFLLNKTLINSYLGAGRNRIKFRVCFKIVYSYFLVRFRPGLDDWIANRMMEYWNISTLWSWFNRLWRHEVALIIVWHHYLRCPNPLFHQRYSRRRAYLCAVADGLKPFRQCTKSCKSRRDRKCEWTVLLEALSGLGLGWVIR